MSQNLSILIDKGGFSFVVWKNCVAHHQAYIPIGAADHDNVFKDIYLQQEYNLVNCAILSPQFALVPKEYFTHEIPLEDWLTFNSQVFEGDVVLHYEIPEQDIFWVYAIDASQKKLFDNKFANTKWHHSGSIFLESLSVDSQEKVLFANIHKNVLEIAVYKEGRLHFYNQFVYRSSNDLMYFILNVYAQLELDTNQDPLYYFGKVQDENLQRLLKFVRHVLPGHEDLSILENYSHYILQ
ncbi:MAG: DUF3822 family protein [Weeksellaceae bacterium]|nr:DUF3822 family protein [Weeksellaceae bacterium]